MLDAQSWAISYLAARGDVPWRWADDGNVIAWTDGTTICFREEIIYILEWLAPRGWPCFGALVWVLAASRGKMPPPMIFPQEANFSNKAAATKTDGGQLTLGDLINRLHQRYGEVERGLAEIVRLPAEARSPVKAKAALAEIVFGQTANGATDRTLLEAVLEVLRAGVLTNEMLNDPGAPAFNEHREWEALHGCLGRITADSLALRMRTGLDALPQAARLPAPPAERIRKLLTELRTDPEHAGLARLARDFMAALQLPRRLSERDDLPLGGLADIANRGNLDRLLLSELAHDDLTLAVRIALGEALYLRREPPAKQPPSTLAVLIDSGIRLWGTPRVLATGVALALIAKSAEHERLEVFRASGAGITPADLLDKAGLVAHLGVLEPHAHPGAALPAFREAVNNAGRAEAIVVTQRDAYHDPDFRRSLAEADFDALYVAIVDRDGSFELLQHPNGATPLCRARVSLDDLLPRPPGSGAQRPPLRDPAAASDRPLALSVKPFPLLIGVAGQVQAAIATSSGGGVCVTRDRRLLAWENSKRGARTLAHGLPCGSAIYLGESSDKTIGVAKLDNDRRRLSCRVFEPDGALLYSHDWHFSGSVRRVERKDGVLFVIRDREAVALDLQQGRQLGSLDTSNSFARGRYFRSKAGYWHLLTWEGQRLRFDPVTLAAKVSHQQVLLLFDRPGFEGPWLLTRQGLIFSNKGKIEEGIGDLGELRSVLRIASDGGRLLVEQANGGKAIADLTASKSWLVDEPPPESAWKSAPYVPLRSVQTRFDRIAILSPGHIHLHSRRSGWWILGREHTSLGRLSRETRSPADAQAISFTPVKALSPEGFSVKAALWSDGRCAWLDGRGMLHLRSARQGVPEVSVALCDQCLAAWSSDGNWTGPEFFIGGHPSAHASGILESIKNFCLPIP